MKNFPVCWAGDWQLKQVQNFTVVGAKKMAATEEQSTATRRTQDDSLCFNHVAKTERAKAGPQMIRTSLRKSFSLFGHRRNWVSANNTESEGKIYESRSIFQDTIMQATSTKDLTYSHGLVNIKYMSVIAETMTLTAVIICNNQTSGSKKCAEMMWIRIALSNSKRGITCSLRWKRLLKNIVSLTPIHKDEQNTKKNSEEIISKFRWIAAIELTIPTFKRQYPARIYENPFIVLCSLFC